MASEFLRRKAEASRREIDQEYGPSYYGGSEYVSQLPAAGAEGIGGKNIRSCVGVGGVNGNNNIGIGQVEKLRRMAGLQSFCLEHSPHTPVKEMVSGQIDHHIPPFFFRVGDIIA